MTSCENSKTADVSLGRPRYHVVAPRGWMNDPCAPGYIPSSNEFTLMYQWNPHSHLWDDISWGHVRSKDLVRWEQVGDEPVFRPDQPYDKEGIFTGCFHPGPVVKSDIEPSDVKDQVAIFYTSVPKLPIHWTREHGRGQEGVACAVSNDGGQTWTKHSSNPIISAEPTHLTVTGFRDPSVVGWHSLDRLLGRPEGQGVYALISGGVQRASGSTSGEEGPRLFLYDVNPRNMLEWTYLSTLGQTYPRGVIPHAWTADLGANWECATIIPLRDERSEEHRDICILGTEGGSSRQPAMEYKKRNPGRKERDARYVHWFMTRISDNAGTASNKANGHSPNQTLDRIDMEYATGGLLDWAELYAFATFPHPDGRRIAWGWLVELDLTDEQAERKGWTGCLGLPRQLSLKVYDRVLGTLGTDLKAIGSFEVKTVEQQGEQVQRLVTLGVEPLEELTSLRGSALLSDDQRSRQMPECFELLLIASTESDSPNDISFILRSDPDSSTTVETRITFSPTAERITIGRENSSPQTDQYSGICAQNEQAPFTLLRFKNGDIERLQMRVFVDRDTIELFVNDRIALSTRVYAPKDANWLRLDVTEGWKVSTLEAWEMSDIGLS